MEFWRGIARLAAQDRVVHASRAINQGLLVQPSEQGLVEAFVDFVVVASGIVEVTLGGATLALGRYRVQAVWIFAAFFIAVLPGNISQFIMKTDAFRLDSDAVRGMHLVFQPLLLLWALWSCEAFSSIRNRKAKSL